MASVLFGAPFYAGRHERAEEDAAHVRLNAARYVDALERLSSAEVQRRAAQPWGDDAARWKVAELLASVRHAETLVRMLGDDESTESLLARLALVQGGVESMAQAPAAQKTQQARRIEEYWDDYLYSGLETRDASEETQHVEYVPLSDETMEEEYGSNAPVAPAAPTAPAANIEPTLQSDRKIHDALSNELLRMAGVLKRNTAAFAQAMEHDRVLVEQAGTRLDQNLSLMTRTRGQLGAFSKKARNMGWFTLGSIVAVMLSWALMFVVIRLT
ncbi:hypothetical protein MVES1_003506 [Malassezia vespertilionis]|nr:uncharacterized protein MVES1_003506 [Malassezia vespertilionis]WFD08136.1 hypothetical protein MVES1_003506 [Malassezia vespertilionis]